MKQKSLLIAALALFSILGVLTVAAAPFGGKILNVQIGKTASTAEGVVWHNISIDSLEEGVAAYEVKAKDDTRYKIQLTEQQIEDVLAGTTVHAKTESGDMKVQITLKDPAPKKSGW